MKKIRTLAIITVLLSAISCDVLMQTASQVITLDQPLTKEEVARGLKEALRVGADSALTNLNEINGYYKKKTYNQLVNLYMPIMQKSLNKPITGNVSASTTWDELTGTWNKFANSMAGKLLDVDAVDTQLDRYVTERALDGVFLKVADREQDIRTKADARVNDLLKRVFGENQ
jgi:hypothetical protein